jgi:hypothetical protein
MTAPALRSRVRQQAHQDELAAIGSLGRTQAAMLALGVGIALPS